MRVLCAFLGRVRPGVRTIPRAAAVVVVTVVLGLALWSIANLAGLDSQAQSPVSTGPDPDNTDPVGPDPDYTDAVWVAKSKGITKLTAEGGAVLFKRRRPL